MEKTIIHSDVKDRDLKIGIDLGGTKVEIILLDSSIANDGNQSDKQTIYRYREATLRGDYQTLVQQLISLVRRVEAELVYIERVIDSRPVTIGIGIPGSISPITGLVRNANTTELNGQPLKQDIEAALGREIMITNDANCFALSEAVDGSGKEAKSVFGVIVGTGVGGGFVVEQRLLGGANGIAGEWGHNPLPWLRESDGPLRDCYCGKQGCIETFLSGSGLVFDYGSLLLSVGEKISTEQTAKQIVELASEGDKLAYKAIDRYADRMARALAHICNIIDPELIVLGGGLSLIEMLYQLVPEYLGQYVFSDKIQVRLVPPKYGDSSGVRGAAWLGC